MKIINSKLHGILDYVVSFIIIISPWLLGFADGKAEMWIPIILGIASIIYSVVTRYELGIWKVLPFKTHLTFDALSGIGLAASPWIFGFANNIYLPHLIFGILEIAVVAFTESQAHPRLRALTGRPLA